MPEPGQMPGSYAHADPQSGIVASELCGGRISSIYRRENGAQSRLLGSGRCRVGWGRRDVVSRCGLRELGY